MLTRDDTWINRSDLVNDYANIVEAVPDQQLRDQVNNYVLQQLSKKSKQNEIDAAIASAYNAFPELFEYYIRYKEDNGEEARAISKEKVDESRRLYVEQFGEFVRAVRKFSDFYGHAGNTVEEARARRCF